MLCGSIYNLCIFHEDTRGANKIFTPDDIALINKTRYHLVVIHSCLCLINVLTHSPRFHSEGIKQLSSFVGMILQVFLILSVSNAIYLYPNPMIFSQFEMAGTFLWLEVEWLVFIGTLLSNIIFIALRTIFKHKIELD